MSLFFVSGDALVSFCCIFEWSSERGQESASSLLLEKQLVFLGKVVRENATGSLHQASFTPGTEQPATSRYVRQVGRPRKEWISSPMPEAYRVAADPPSLNAAVQNKLHWKRMVETRS